MIVFHCSSSKIKSTYGESCGYLFLEFELDLSFSLSKKLERLRIPLDFGNYFSVIIFLYYECNYTIYADIIAFISKLKARYGHEEIR